MKFSRITVLLGNTAAAVRIDRALDGLSQLAIHEAEALDRHVLAVRERMRVARKARGVVELVRDQFDLLPATAARFAQDHQARRHLWRTVRQALTDRSTRKAA